MAIRKARLVTPGGATFVFDYRIGNSDKFRSWIYWSFQFGWLLTNGG